MKLIEGRTLAELLRERPHPGHDLPRFLRHFEAICQAIGHAHSRGVIHRDLKPANVMVGPFGEVQVMDWGLAKRLSPRPAAADTAGAEASALEVAAGDPETTSLWPAPAPETGEPGRTHPGSVMATPAYAAPEQAEGSVDLVDQRSDVFGMGAILCEVLTAQPPYVATDSLQLHRMAAKADLADAQARLRGCAADAELVELALSCLAAQPADRPRDGQAVAAALTAYLDGVQARLRQAELAEAEARASAAGEAKRRRLALALAGTVLLLVTSAAGGLLWLQADRQARQAQLQARQVEVSRDVNDALQQVTALRAKARDATADSAALFAEAYGQVQGARTLIESGPADEALGDQVRRAEADLEEEDRDRRFIAAIEDARLAQAETIADENWFATERAVPLFREAFRACGMPVGEGDPAAVAGRLRQRLPRVREVAVAALDEWIAEASLHPDRAHGPHVDWLRAVVLSGPDEGRMREILAAWKEPDDDKRRAALEKLAAAGDVRRLPPHTLTRLARLLMIEQSTHIAVELLRRARRQSPDDFWVNRDLASALTREQTPHWPEVVRCRAVTVALRPRNPLLHVKLGGVLMKAGEVDEGIACFEQAVALGPKYARSHTELGIALKEKGRPDEAIASYELGSRRANWKYPSAQWVHDCQELIEREKRLDDVLSRKRRPVDAREHIEWANLSFWTWRYAAAARLYGEAFAPEAKLADDLRASHRYQAATASARAAAGQGRDAGGLSDTERTKVRGQTLARLKADLAARTKQAAGERAAALRHWLADEELAGVRGEQALRALPQGGARCVGRFLVRGAKGVTRRGRPLSDEPLFHAHAN
jgi:serine/threonine-protein kinase